MTGRTLRSSEKAGRRCRGPLLLLLSAAALFCSFGNAFAESIWDLEGIGRPISGYDIAGRAGGGTGIGIADYFAMSDVNPANIAWARLPQAQFGYIQETRSIASDHASSRRTTGRLDGARGVLTGPGPLRWGIGYRDVTDGTFQIEIPFPLFNRQVTGFSGLSKFHLGVASALWQQRLALGLQYGFLQGTIRETWNDVFTASGYVNTRNTLRTRMDNGKVLSLGTQLRPLPGLVAGATVQTSTTLDLRELWSTTAGFTKETRARVDYPSAYGAGLSYTYRGRDRLALDWSSQRWSDARLVLQPSGAPAGFGPMSDQLHLGIGYTRIPVNTMPKDPLMKRTVWRAGFSWTRLPWQQILRGADGTVSEVEVKEWAVTAGMGLPIQVDRGYLDLLLEAGRTGDLTDVRLRETFVRVGIGVTIGRLTGKF